MVVYERFQYKVLTENIFGVLERWWPIREVVVRGGSTVLFSNLLLIRSVNNPTHMYLSDLIVCFKVEVYFRVT